MKPTYRNLLIIILMTVSFCLCYGGVVTNPAMGALASPNVHEFTWNDVVQLRKDAQNLHYSIYDTDSILNYENNEKSKLDNFLILPPVEKSNVLSSSRSYIELPDKLQDWNSLVEKLENVFSSVLLNYYLNSQAIIENEGNIWRILDIQLTSGINGIWYSDEIKFVKESDDIILVYEKAYEFDPRLIMAPYYKLTDVFEYSNEKDKWLISYLPTLGSYDLDSPHHSQNFLYGSAGDYRESYVMWILGSFDGISDYEINNFIKYDRISEVAITIQKSLSVYNYYNTTSLFPFFHEEYINYYDVIKEDINGKTYDSIVKNSYFIFNYVSYEELKHDFETLFTEDLAEKYLSRDVIIKVEREEDSDLVDFAILAEKEGKTYDFGDPNFSFEIIIIEGDTDIVRLYLPEYDENGKLIEINDSLMIIKDGKIVYEEYSGLYGDNSALSKLERLNPRTSDYNYQIYVIFSFAVILCGLMKFKYRRGKKCQK